MTSKTSIATPSAATIVIEFQSFPLSSREKTRTSSFNANDEHDQKNAVQMLFHHHTGQSYYSLALAWVNLGIQAIK
uniref:Uncharacterized protein n=1 Tax=Arion vulgaris TaxID=1028688 RepID=A0A0B7AQB4_9EUPU